MQTNVKKLAEEREVVRKILTEINNFGVTQHQRLFLIYTLALEIEDLETRFDISTVARSRMQELNFLVTSDDEK